MGKKHFKDRAEKDKINAKKVIASLFEEARKTKEKHLSDRYVSLARKTAMKFKIRLPSVYQRQFCKHCYSFLRPGVNARVRLRTGKIVYYCTECRKHSRIPYSKKAIILH